MYWAYQSGQFSSRWPPVRFSCSPWAAAARRSVAANSFAEVNIVTSVSTRPGNEHDRTSLLQTILKVMQVSNGIYTIHRNIEGSVENAREQGAQGAPLWTMVHPVAGRTEIPKFDSSDFVPFAVSGRADLINRIIMISNRYEATESGFREYSERRLSFQDLAGPYTTLGPSGQHMTAFPEDVAAQAQMRAYELEQLITQVRDFANKDLEESKSLCSDIDKFAKAYLKGKGGFVSLGLDEVKQDVGIASAGH